MSKQIPFIHVSFAQSLDGRIATKTGDTRYISSPETLNLAHQLRAQNEAILVGIGTILNDNPSLSCRLASNLSRQPVRVILDSQLRIPLESKIVQTANEQRTIIFYSNTLSDFDEKITKLSNYKVELINISENSSKHLDLNSILENLALLSIKSVLVEGGSHILTSFFDQNLVDQFTLVISPIMIGRGVQAIGDLNIQKLSQAKKFKTIETKTMGPDLVWKMIPIKN